MSKQPTTETPVDNKKNGNGHAAPSDAVADTSVDTENPNDAIEAYHQRLREQIDKP
jgi:hypothetical protein